MSSKTEPMVLEHGMKISLSNGECRIQVGGGQMPSYNVTGVDLEEAIGSLVTETTRDAIEDEAREWKPLFETA